MIAKIVLLAALWWVLAGADPDGWWVGVPAVLGGAWIAHRAFPRPPPLSIAGLARFFGFFLHHAVAGGVDVAARVLRPSLPIAPVFVAYPLTRVQGTAGRCLFVATLSLMPGTLAAALDGATVELHALDPRIASIEALAALEARVAAVFVEEGRAR
jgi:multicomponent Na+:H+ antiporter subunit E